MSFADGRAQTGQQDFTMLQLSPGQMRVAKSRNRRFSRGRTSGHAPTLPETKRPLTMALRDRTVGARSQIALNLEARLEDIAALDNFRFCV
jgi:hypothetical protein